MKCSSCGHWNRVPVNKILIEQNSPEPKVKVVIPMFFPEEEEIFYETYFFNNRVM